LPSERGGGRGADTARGARHHGHRACQRFLRRRISSC
jgi:hypothetical protein